ncbi:MAG: RNA polymerase sigma factor [Solirubrobacterales bacterium]
MTRDRGESDAALVRRAGAGDGESAVRTLIDRYGRRVYAIGLRTLRDPRLAEDLVQETFVRLWRMTERFDSQRGSLGSYLFTIARNTAIDLHRARRGPTEELPTELEGEEGDAYARLIANMALREAMGELPEVHRKVLELAYDEGLTQVEIAERLEVPVGTVKSRTFHALEALREALDPEMEIAYE